MKKNNGISIIVLVITIIIIIILSGSIILALSQSNLLNNAQQSKFKSDITTLKEHSALALMSLAASNEEIKISCTLDELLSEDVNSSYNTKFYIENGQFVFTNECTELEKQWAKEINISGFSEMIVPNGAYKISNLNELKVFRDEINSGNNFSGKDVYLVSDIDMGSIWNESGNLLSGEIWTPIGNQSTPFSGTFYGCNHKINNIYISSNTNNSGLFGYNEGIIKDLNIQSGYMATTAAYLGNIVGYNLGTVINCINNVNSYGYGNNDEKIMGGISGYNTSTGIIQNCINLGSIYGTKKLVGGICGYSFGKIIDCYNTGGITSDAGQVGGIVGDNQGGNGIIENCYNKGNISGTNEIGGIVGCNYFSSDIDGCHNEGTVTASENWVGGIAGVSYTGKIQKCYNIGNITSTGGSSRYTGGIVGLSEQAITTNCYNIGNIKGTLSVGGISGREQYGNDELTNCYNSGSVLGSQWVGGIVGYVQNTSLTKITNCYNIGFTSGSTYIGGVIGFNNSATISNCYYLYGISESGIGYTNVTTYITSKSSNDMKTEAFMQLLHNGSTGIWKQDPNYINSGYPVLDWQSNINNNSNQMIIKTGLNYYFDANDYTGGSTWNNQLNSNNLEIKGTAYKESDSVVLEGTSNSYAELYAPKAYNRTIYLIAKCSNTSSGWKGMLTTGIISDSTYKSFDIFSYENIVASSTIWGDIHSTYSSLNYNVIAIVSDISNSSYKLYINGIYIGTQTLSSTNYWNDYIYLAAQYRNGISYYNNEVKFKFIAISNIMHSESEIIQNSQWLMQKYRVVN